MCLSLFDKRLLYELKQPGMELIWNPNSKYHRNTMARHYKWQEVAGKMGTIPFDCQVRWKLLKQKYFRLNHTLFKTKNDVARKCLMEAANEFLSEMRYFPLDEFKMKSDYGFAQSKPNTGNLFKQDTMRPGPSTSGIRSNAQFVKPAENDRFNSVQHLLDMTAAEIRADEMCIDLEDEQGGPPSKWRRNNSGNYAEMMTTNLQEQMKQNAFLVREVVNLSKKPEVSSKPISVLMSFIRNVDDEVANWPYAIQVKILTYLIGVLDYERQVVRNINAQKFN